MFDMWVEDLKTKKCWRVTQDEGTKLIENTEDISRYKFYPCCPKKAPEMELPQEEFTQMSIFDFEGKTCENCKHSIKRNENDFQLDSKLTYGLRCKRNGECKHLYDNCENWERGQDEISN